MGKTSIEWTERTWNPIRGCSKISPACENCYAMHVAARFSGKGQPYEGLAKRNPVNWTGKLAFVDSLLHEPLRRHTPTTYFVNSMSDLFHESLPDDQIDQVFAVMALGGQHLFQVLTKRMARAASYLKASGRFDAIYQAAEKIAEAAHISDFLFDDDPFPNVQIGFSAENQECFDRRVTDAQPVMELGWFVWVSAEPLLGPIEMSDCLCGDRVRWVVVGGESGRNARPCNADWIRAVIKQCEQASVPCFVKQLGAYPIDSCQACDGTFSDEWPPLTRASFFAGDGVHVVHLRNSKGSDPSEWPEELRVRQFVGAVCAAH